MTWHYWPPTLMLGMIYLPLHVTAALIHGLTPFHMVHANPVFPRGISLSKKDRVLALFKGKKQFLEFTVVGARWPLPRKRAQVQKLMRAHGLSYPLMAKPRRGHVGIGVVKIASRAQLDSLLERIPVDYIFQEFCDYPEKYGLFYCRYPGKSARAISLTRKIIPEVTGDGRSTVRQLVAAQPAFACNRRALLGHARGLDRVLPSGRRHQVIVQASHTYGAIFKDLNHLIDDRMHRWVDEAFADVRGFHFGRFDLKARSQSCLYSGDGLKIVELNGEGADPIHVYDDRHPLNLGLREFLRFYRHLYAIARLNTRRLDLKPSFRGLSRLFLRDAASKRTAFEVIG